MSHLSCLINSHWVSLWIWVLSLHSCVFSLTSWRSDLLLAISLSSLPYLFVRQWGTIKVIPLSPPCSPPRDLLNVIHCHLICDQEYNGSDKLEGTVLWPREGVPFRIIVDRQIASCWRGALKGIWCVFTHMMDHTWSNTYISDSRKVVMLCKT